MYRLIAALLFMSLASGELAAAPVALDAQRWQQLVDTSRTSFDLADVRDTEKFRHADYWEVADTTGGDCEDKALRNCSPPWQKGLATDSAA